MNDDITIAHPPTGLFSQLAGGVDVALLGVGCGAGHVAAARAIAQAMQSQAPHLDCAVGDIGGELPRWFRLLYIQLFNFLCTRLPSWFGALVEATDFDIPVGVPLPWPQNLRLRLEIQALQHLTTILQQQPPRALVHTHFLLPGVLAAQRQAGALPGQHAVVVTDYTAHRAWVQAGVDKYFVATNLARHSLLALGVPSAAIEITGIPIAPEWAQPVDVAPLRAELGLDETLPVVIFSGGTTFVSDGFEAMVKHCVTSYPPAQYVALTGHNHGLTQRLQNLAAEQPQLHVQPYTTRMRELMGLATVVVGKAGGLTTAEAMAAGVPQIFVNPIPGVEDRNSDYLLSCGVAWRAPQRRVVPAMIEALLTQPATLARMRERSLACAKPNAAATIAAWAASA